MFQVNRKLLKNFEKLILFFLKIINIFKKKNSIRILVYHHIKKENIQKFENQILMLKKEWNFITPDEFENHILEKKKLIGKNLLLTFDDGFKSNFFVAKEVLEKLSIKAIFFVPSDFVQIKFQDEAISFAKKNILDETTSDDLNNIDNLSLYDLKQLIERGHKIGCHTKTHAHLGSINDEENLKIEIKESMENLEKLLNKKIKHFAFTYGNYKSMNFNSLKIAFLNYNFIYSCLRGNNFYNDKDSIIKRDTIYLDESNDLMQIFLFGFLDIKYSSSVNKINKIIMKILNN